MECEFVTPTFWVYFDQCCFVFLHVRVNDKISDNGLINKSFNYKKSQIYEANFRSVSGNSVEVA